MDESSSPPERPSAPRSPDGVGVLGQRGDLDLHVRVHREPAQDPVQLVVGLDVEQRVVRVAAAIVAHGAADRLISMTKEIPPSAPS